MDRPSSSPADLITVLRRELAILERLRYSHRQLRVLFEAGDRRFLGVGLEELCDVMAELETAEILRIEATANLASSVHMQPTATLNDLVVRLPSALGQSLMSLQRDLEGLLADVDFERRRVRTLAHAQVTAGSGKRRAG